MKVPSSAQTPHLLINDEAVDSAALGRTVLTINGQNAPVYYTFSVNSSVEKLIRNGATTNISDTMITDWTTDKYDLPF